MRVVVDANVLYPFTLRDTMLRAAAADLYQLYWSPRILHETTQNLVEHGGMSSEQATRLGAVMMDAFPGGHGDRLRTTH